MGLHIRPTDSGFDLFVGFNESTTDKVVWYFKNLLYNLFLTTLPAFVQCCSSLWYTIKTTHQSTWAWATPNQFALVEIVIQMYCIQWLKILYSISWHWKRLSCGFHLPENAAHPLLWLLVYIPTRWLTDWRYHKTIRLSNNSVYNLLWKIPAWLLLLLLHCHYIFYLFESIIFCTWSCGTLQSFYKMCVLYITKQYMSDNRLRQVRLCISLDNPVNFAAMLWWCSSLIL